jgi:hypothetical protein
VDNLIHRPRPLHHGDLDGTPTAVSAGSRRDLRFSQIVDDAVLERTWLWRAVTARAAGLAPDVVAERLLEQWVSNPDTRAATAGMWSNKLDSGIVRLTTARVPIPDDADVAARALDRASKMDPADLVSVFVGAAATVAATIPRVECFAETPATVAARMVCFAPTYQNVDMFAVAILDAVTDARYDLAVALLAGVIQGLPPTAPPVVALGPYLSTLTLQHPLPDVVASRRLRTATGDPRLSADVSALATDAANLIGFAARYGWDRAGRACAALIVETSLVTADADHRPATTVLAELLAGWTLFEQDMSAALGMRARRERYLGVEPTARRVDTRARPGGSATTMPGMDEGGVRAGAWVMRAVTARAAGLAPDDDAERHLVQLLADPAERALTVARWRSNLGAFVGSSDTADADDDADLDGPHGFGDAARTLFDDPAVDPADLVNMYVASAAELAAAVPGGIDETPAACAARVARLANADHSLEMSAVAILDAAAVARHDLAVELLAGVIQASYADTACTRELGPYLTAVVAYRPPVDAPDDVPRFAAGAVHADAEQLAADTARFREFVAVNGWDRAGHAAAAVIVETAAGTAARRQLASDTLAQLLERWSMFEQVIPRAIGLRTHATRAT